MLLGLAIGDALGNTSEGMNPEDRHQKFGRLTQYQPNWYADHRPVGVPTDDTQLAAWTLEHLLEHDDLSPRALSDTFAHRRIFGMGQATRAFQQARRAGASWTEAGRPSAGNGVLMRIAATLPRYLRAGGRDPWAAVALNAFLTHNDRLAISSALAFSRILWKLLAGEQPSGPDWWLDGYVEFARPLEDAKPYATRVPQGRYLGWSGTSADFVDQEVRRALRDGNSVFDAQHAWHSGAYLMETIPTVLMILARHGHDPRAALESALNDSRDNDTIGAIVGAAVGALHGEEALPTEWRAGLLGRTGVADDGRYQELVAATVERWCA
jgi:ADP-ribosylglycohydrolase